MTAALHSWTQLKAGSPVFSFDMSCAFDTLRAPVLLQTMKRLNMDQSVITWVESYLSTASQRVCWNCGKSPLLSTEACCKQGSILAPLFYIIVAIPLTAVITRPASYADDTSGGSRNMEEANTCAANFARVTQAAGLSLNASKTQLIIIGRPRSDLSMIVDNCLVPAGSSISFLGIELDCTLSTTPYLDGLIVDCRRRVGILRLIETRIGRSNLEIVIQGLLYGKLAYLLGHCLPVRVDEAEIPSVRARKLQIVVNDAMRLLAGVRRSDRVKLTDLRDDVNIPTVNYVVAR